MANRLPCYTRACSRQHMPRVFEAARECKAVLDRHMHIGERNICLPDSAFGYLAGHHRWLKAGRALLDQEATHVALVITCPDNNDVGE